jgi:hypothetical protein
LTGVCPMAGAASAATNAQAVNARAYRRLKSVNLITRL